MMNNKKNFVSAVILQCVHMMYGLVVPRIILSIFGSEINGLVSSITQFLSFITLLEGGLGAVVLAELYKPIEEKNMAQIRGILNSSQSFFNKIAVVYIAYAVFVGIGFGINLNSIYSFVFVLGLTLILSLTTLSEYLFSITIRLFLQADQKIYITNIIYSLVLVLNIVFAIISIKIYPDIIILKLSSGVAFFLQPLILRFFIPNELKKNKYDRNQCLLKNRWDGFAQNLAHFININTDIILVTLFCSFGEVSVYSVHMLAVNALRMLLSTAADSYQSALGRYIVQGDIHNLVVKFREFLIGISILSLILFSTCLLMINSFSLLYSEGVHDVNYYRPLFAFIIITANFIFCIREPYRLLILAAGRFRQTNFGAIMEAVLNLVISIVLIFKFELFGVAVGTLVAVSFRMIYFIYYLKKENFRIGKNYSLRLLISVVLVFLINTTFYFCFPIKVESISLFIIYGFILIIIESTITYLMFKYICRCRINLRNLRVELNL